MDQAQAEDGTIAWNVPTVDFPCSTFYKVVGNLSCGSPPVIIVHGGPGAGHEYLLTFAELWTRYGLPVIFYDQIGCASSTHLPQKAGDESFWQESLFLTELDHLIEHFHLREGPGFHLLGQSWGGMLGAAFAARQPRGLRRLVLASALASQDLNIQGIKLLKGQLPSEAQRALQKAEVSGDFDSPEYQEAQGIFFRKHACRADPFPPAQLLPALKHLSDDPSVYRTMYGRNALQIGGSLSGWTSIPGLPKISVPTLVYNGEYDTSHDIATVPFFENIPRVRWITFPNAGHMCHVEGKEMREKVLQVVGDFLCASARA